MDSGYLARWTVKNQYELSLLFNVEWYVIGEDEDRLEWIYLSINWRKYAIILEELYAILFTICTVIALSGLQSMTLTPSLYSSLSSSNIFHSSGTNQCYLPGRYLQHLNGPSFIDFTYDFRSLQFSLLFLSNFLRIFYSSFVLFLLFYSRRTAECLACSSFPLSSSFKLQIHNC